MLETREVALDRDHRDSVSNTASEYLVGVISHVIDEHFTGCFVDVEVLPTCTAASCRAFRLPPAQTHANHDQGTKDAKEKD